MSARVEGGDWIIVEHSCRTRGDQITVHADPVKVRRVVRLNDGHHRIEATRCDGTAMHVYTEEDEYTVVLQPAEADVS